jgi:hypothetical protein
MYATAAAAVKLSIGHACMLHLLRKDYNLKMLQNVEFDNVGEAYVQASKRFIFVGVFTIFLVACFP